MGALDVLPLALAKRYLNIPAADHQHDDELTEDFVPPAVQRVAEHVGRELVDSASCTPLERLALKMVVEEYWKTQRAQGAGGRGSYGGASRTAIDADSGPAGTAPLRVRLEELLGPAAVATGPAPRGSFPPPSTWPDPTGEFRRGILGGWPC